MTRALGDGGPPLSPISLGLAALGRPGYINLGHAEDLQGARDVDALRDRAWAVLDAAWAAGVRSFDAARSYGQAEAFLSGWLHARKVAPDSVTVSSKWGYTYTAAWQMDAERHEVKEHSAENLDRQWPETQALLGPWLRAYLIHSATLESGVLENGAVLERLAARAERGLRVGLSLSGPRQADTLRRALTVQVNGQNPFSVVQATWNLMEPSCGPALAEARAAGWTVVVKEAVANGRLTARGAEARHPALRAVCAHTGATPDAVALAAALAQPWISTALSGATSVEQLHSNLHGLHLKLTPTDLAELGALALPAERYWAERGALPWN